MLAEPPGQCLNERWLAVEPDRAIAYRVPPGAPATRDAIKGPHVGLDEDVAVLGKARILDTDRGLHAALEDEPRTPNAGPADVQVDHHPLRRKSFGVDAPRQSLQDDVRIALHHGAGSSGTNRSDHWRSVWRIGRSWRPGCVRQ